MKVTTNINRSDILRFNLSVIPKMKSTYYTVLVFGACAAVFLLWKEGIPTNANGLFKIAFVSLCGGVGAIIGGTVVSLISILFMSSATNGILGEHHYEISEKGLYEKTIANEGLSKWSGIIEIKESGGYLLFQISGYLFHIIPKRCFSSNEEYSSFLKYSISHWSKVHNKKLQQT